MVTALNSVLCIRYKCNASFEYEVQRKLCKEYWDLGNSEKQKLYISSLIENVPVRRRKNSAFAKNRSTSRVLYLRDTLGEKKRVCLKFFCSTFAISHHLIQSVMENVGFGGVYVSHDKRIGFRPFNATPQESVAFVKKHIESFPVVESHYCRKDSNKVYLNCDLNLSIMYRLYARTCAITEKPPVSKFMYRKILMTTLVITHFINQRKINVQYAMYTKIPPINLH